MRQKNIYIYLRLYIYSQEHHMCFCPLSGIDFPLRKCWKNMFLAPHELRGEPDKKCQWISGVKVQPSRPIMHCCCLYLRPILGRCESLQLH